MGIVDSEILFEFGNDLFLIYFLSLGMLIVVIYLVSAYAFDFLES